MIDLVELKSDFGLKYQTKTKVTKTKLYFCRERAKLALTLLQKQHDEF